MKIGDLVKYNTHVFIEKVQNEVVFLITDVRDGIPGGEQALCVGPEMGEGRWVHASNLKVINKSD